jgi:beta-glucosidase
MQFWGTGASAVQTEGACPDDSWYAWEKAGKAPASGAGNGFADRFRDDLALFSEWGFTDHRLSVNWARVQPAPDRVDADAVTYYRDVLAAGRAAGLRMWVTLLHTAVPSWLAEQGGVLGPDFGRHWRRWVDVVGERFGDLTDGWMPVNNPTSFAQKAYLTGTFPPGLRSVEDFGRALTAVHTADVTAATILRAGGRPVCSNQSLIPLFPADGSAAAAAATAQFDAAVWRSWLGRADDVFDHHGFSYYGAAAIDGQGRPHPYPLGAAPGPLGYVPWADGLKVVLDRLAEELPGRSVVVAELGYGGTDDAARSAYLSAAMTHIRAAGSPVAGVFFWTGVDNYEWLAGWSVPFGLFDADRRPRGSAELVRSWAP